MRNQKLLRFILLFFLLSLFACTSKKESSSPGTLAPIVYSNVPGDEAPIVDGATGPVRTAVPAFAVTAEPEPEVVTYTGTSN